MPIWPHRVTFTGVDERTSHYDIALMLGWHQVELGILYTTAPAGRNRYPSESWIKDTVYKFPRRCALHVCGRGARAAMLEGQFAKILPLITRVQVNGFLREDEAIAMHARVPELITQHNAGNTHLMSLPLSHHSLLVDASGGRGILPAAWMQPNDALKPVGYAGGLGPDTICDALPKIAAIAQAGAWIDMEGRIRTHDWFDVSLAGRVMWAILS